MRKIFCLLFYPLHKWIYIYGTYEPYCNRDSQRIEIRKIGIYQCKICGVISKGAWKE